MVAPVSALQDALAAEDAAIFGYGVAGAHLSGTGQAAAEQDWTGHSEARDQLVTMIAIFAYLVTRITTVTPGMWHRRLSEGDRRDYGVKTILPVWVPSIIAAKPSRASAKGTTRSIRGRVPVCSQKRRRRPSWSRVPIVEPTTDNWVKKILVSSAGGMSATRRTSAE